MKSTLRALCCTGLVAGLASLASAADMTMTGMISDSMCGTSHAKMIEMHKGAKMTERDCTLACVKAGGQYVFVSDGKVYKIANQKLAALEKDAGMSVSLTGNVNGDTITVSKIAKK
jgi:hypothetical protein